MNNNEPDPRARSGDADVPHFQRVLEQACGDKAQRAILRRCIGITPGNANYVTGVTIIGSAISEHDSAADLMIKLGVAGLFAKHGRRGASHRFRNVGAILQMAKSPEAGLHERKNGSKRAPSAAGGTKPYGTDPRARPSTGPVQAAGGEHGLVAAGKRPSINCWRRRRPA